MNRIEYQFRIVDASAGIEILITDESIDFKKLNEESIIRLRHNKLAVQLVETMKDFIREAPKNANPR